MNEQNEFNPKMNNLCNQLNMNLTMKMNAAQQMLIHHHQLSQVDKRQNQQMKTSKQHKY